MYTISNEYTNMLIIYTNTENIRYMTLMRWSVLTKFMLKNSLNFFKYGNNMYNARAENIFDPKSTWYKIKQNRCLIATDGIYEHRKIIG
jgi:putative SOS response-associated peptidase YedK